VWNTLMRIPVLPRVLPSFVQEHLGPTMGHTGSIATNSVRCCQQEPASLDWADELRRGEVNLQDEHYNGSSTGYADPNQTLAKSVTYLASARGFACCNEQSFDESGTLPLQPLEALSYTPFRFDEGQTIDVERSHQRYSDTLLHSNRATTQKRSKAWGNWISAATAGRAATLLTGIPEPGDQQITRPLVPVPAKYYLDKSGTCLSIWRPQPGTDAAMTEVLSITIDTIQVISPVMDVASCRGHLDASNLSAAEQRCAVLLQYTEDDKVDRRRACLVVESEAARDDFVQGLMALWLETRKDHSMWF